MENRNLIISAFCDIDGMKSGLNISDNADRKAVYYKNVIVSLISFKTANKDSDVALFTNITPPEIYCEILRKNDIEIKIYDFDEFNFKNNISWGLAFYKLCALKHAIELDYDNFLIVDNDTYCQSNLDDLWLELEENVLLYDINHRLKIRDCDLYNKEVFSFTRKKIYPTNYGGEFIAGSKEKLKVFINECSEIFNQMLKNDFKTNFGDEFIVRLAAYNNKKMIKNSSGYIFRYWTKSFRLVSTCYKYNEVSIIHVPDEKEDGMLKLYKCILKKGKIPTKEYVWKVLHLVKPAFKQRVKNLIKKILKRDF